LTYGKWIVIVLFYSLNVTARGGGFASMVHWNPYLTRTMPSTL